MSYDNLSSVSQNVLKFYQQLTGEERRIPFIFDDFHFCRSRVIGLEMTENRIFTLCRMITWVVFLRMFWYFILMCSYVHSNIEIHHLKFSSRNMVLILDLHQILLQICFGSIKMMGTQGVLVPCSEQFHLCIKVGLMRPAVPLVFFIIIMFSTFFSLIN